MVERRATLRHDRMVCFDDGTDRFQMRAAGIALRNGRVLVQNVKGDPSSSIPGGRIDQNEASADTVVREYREEFGLEVSIGPLAYVIESFSLFPEHAQFFHEVGFYFPILNPELLPYSDSGVCHRFQEGPVEIEYRWVAATPEVLTAARLVPDQLRGRIAALPTSTMHIVDDRR